MKNKIVIFGKTMFSSQLYIILKHEGYDIVAFTVDKLYRDSTFFEDLPLFPFEELENYVEKDEIEIALSIGYNHMNDVRKGKYLECKMRGFKILTFVSKEAHIYTDEIGEGCLIMPKAYIGPFSKLGVCCVIWPGVVLAHHNELDDYNWIAPSCCWGGGASSGKNCFLGIGSTVRNEIRLANYTFISAHTYIGKETIPGGAYLGVPAKLLPNTNSLEIVAKV